MRVLFFPRWEHCSHGEIPVLLAWLCGVCNPSWELLMCTVQRFKARDGGRPHPAGLVGIFTDRNSNHSFFLCSTFRINEHVNLHCLSASPPHHPFCLFANRKKYPQWWGRGWMRCFSMKKIRRGRNGFIRMRKRLRGISTTALHGQVKWTLISTARFEFEGTVCPKIGIHPGNTPFAPLRERAYLPLKMWCSCCSKHQWCSPSAPQLSSSFSTVSYPVMNQFCSRTHYPLFCRRLRGLNTSQNIRVCTLPERSVQLLISAWSKQLHLRAGKLFLAQPT